jgi:hypothetical protein
MIWPLPAGPIAVDDLSRLSPVALAIVESASPRRLRLLLNGSPRSQRIARAVAWRRMQGVRS